MDRIAALAAEDPDFARSVLRAGIRTSVMGVAMDMREGADPVPDAAPGRAPRPR